MESSNTPTRLAPGFFDESILVVPEPVSNPLQWFLFLSVGLVTLFAVYLFCLPGAKTSERPPVTTDDEHRQQIIRYQLNDNPEVVFVGSSLAHALKPEYFSANKVNNLALPGGSPLTGLTILSSARHLPRVLIIETNILGEKPDPVLIDYFRPVPPLLEEPRRLVRDFKPLRTALSVLLNADPSSDTMLKKPPQRSFRRAEFAKRAETLLSQPPSDYDTKDAVSRALANGPSEEFISTVRQNACRIVEMADDFEKKGTKVFLIEMPLMPCVAEGWYSSKVREAIQDANGPQKNRWMTLSLDEAQLRWGDAYHLDERSSILVIKAIEDQLKDRQRRPEDPHSGLR